MQTHHRDQLYAAAQERMAAARVLQAHVPGDVAAAYVAGLAVELMLQALSHLDAAEHDARHRLDLWLAKCSPTLQNTMRAMEAWSILDTGWTNRLRYYSRAQWLRVLRMQPDWRLKGDDDARARQLTGDFVDAAENVLKKGMAEWRRKHS